jgi:hypothetical protein
MRSDYRDEPRGVVSRHLEPRLAAVEVSEPVPVVEDRITEVVATALRRQSLLPQSLNERNHLDVNDPLPV